MRLIYLGLAAICWPWIYLAGRIRRTWVVLCYHAVRPCQATRFEKQLRRLAGRAVAVDQIGNGKPGVCLTFDDAFACLLEAVVPLASQFNLPIAIFPVTENMNKTPQWDMPVGHPERDLRTMSKEELLALRDHPLITIGSHTATHPRLAEVLPGTVQRELQSSSDSLGQLLTRPPMDLALPHGSCNAQICETAQAIGYRRIFTLDPMANFKLSSDGRIGRFSVSPDMWMIEFRLTAAGAYAYLLPLRYAINKIRTWAMQTRSPLASSRFVEHSSSR